MTIDDSQSKSRLQKSLFVAPEWTVWVLYFLLTSFLIWISYGVRRHNHARWLFLQSRINQRLFIWQAKIKCGFSQRINKILLAIIFSFEKKIIWLLLRDPKIGSCLMCVEVVSGHDPMNLRRVKLKYES